MRDTSSSGLQYSPLARASQAATDSESKDGLQQLQMLVKEIPALFHAGWESHACLLLQYAEPLARSAANGIELLDVVLNVSLQVYAEQPAKVTECCAELTVLLAQHGRYKELISRFAELKAAAHLVHLSRQQLTILYREVKAAEDSGKDEMATSLKLMTVGRALAERLSVAALEESAENAAATRSEHKALLWELYWTEPAPDLAEKLGELTVLSTPVLELKAALARLPDSVLHAACAYVSGQGREQGCVPRHIEAMVLVAAASRSEQLEAYALLHQALRADPTSLEAADEIMKVLLQRLQQGIDTKESRRELAQLLLEHAKYDIFADNFAVLKEVTDFNAISADCIGQLATSLVASGRKTHAAETAVILAKVFEEEGSPEAALQQYMSAFEWNPGNSVAEAGMKRLGLKAGHERAVAAKLVSSAAGQDDIAMTRIEAAMNLLAQELGRVRKQQSGDLSTEEPTDSSKSSSRSSSESPCPSPRSRSPEINKMSPHQPLPGSCITSADSQTPQTTWTCPHPPHAPPPNAGPQRLAACRRGVHHEKNYAFGSSLSPGKLRPNRHQSVCASRLAEARIRARR